VGGKSTFVIPKGSRKDAKFAKGADKLNAEKKSTRVGGEDSP